MDVYTVKRKVKPPQGEKCLLCPNHVPIGFGATLHYRGRREKKRPAPFPRLGKLCPFCATKLGIPNTRLGEYIHRFAERKTHLRLTKKERRGLRTGKLIQVGDRRSRQNTDRRSDKERYRDLMRSYGQRP